MPDNRIARPGKRNPTEPCGSQYWARQKEMTAGLKRSADNLETRSGHGEHGTKRTRRNSDAGDPGRQTVAPALRDLKELHIKAELEHAVTRDQLAQMKQVLHDVTRQLVEAKVDQFHDTITREEVISMLQSGMPSWIAKDLFDEHPLDELLRDSAPCIAANPLAARLPATAEYFVEGSVFDDHVGDYNAATTASANRRAIMNEDLAKLLPGADYRRSLKTILWRETDKYRLPAPVGRYGHPFCKGWMWEDFNAKRLFDRGRPDYVPCSSPAFNQLAQEAVQIPFACRSTAQRQVVSMALTQRVLPLAGMPAEPNVLQFCKENTALLPYAIRRQYTCDHDQALVYSEWDAVDLGVYIVLKMAAPAKASSSDAQRHQYAQWLTAIQYTLYWASSENACWWTSAVPEEYTDGPRPYDGALDDYDGIFSHLQWCGLYYETLLDGPYGDVYNYVQRMASCEGRKNELTQQYELALAPGARANQRQLREFISKHMLYERVPEGDPVVRIKLTNAKVQALLDQRQKIVEYTTY